MKKTTIFITKEKYLNDETTISGFARNNTNHFRFYINLKYNIPYSMFVAKNGKKPVEIINIDTQFSSVPSIFNWIKNYFLDFESIAENN